MRHDFTLERRAILFGVVALVAADIALAVYGWNLSSARRPQQDPARPRARLTREMACVSIRRFATNKENKPK